MPFTEIDGAKYYQFKIMPQRHIKFGSKTSQSVPVRKPSFREPISGRICIIKCYKDHILALYTLRWKRITIYQFITDNSSPR